MTIPPFPVTPCLRVNLKYTNGDGTLAGSRFFLSYGGAAPSAGTLTTLATDIAEAWATNIAPIVHTAWSLTEVDIEDIATDTGLSGTVSVTDGGGEGGTELPAQVANNIEFDISRRYRGGKPRMYLPPASFSQTSDAAHWSGEFITATNTAVAAFFTAIAALSVGSLGALAHVNLSYYLGFVNVTNSSGRIRAAPKYRAAALVDPVTGYAAKGLLGSQRRRRASTSA